MRTINDHKVNPANDMISVEVIDQPGAGGANHVYRIDWGSGAVTLQFQNGPIAEAGVNGIVVQMIRHCHDSLCHSP